MSEERPADSEGKIIVFGAKRIRRAWVGEQWYFSVVDIVAALTDSDNPRDYWYRMKQREQEASGIELSTLCRQLKLTSPDGKSYKTDCVNTEAAFRFISDSIRLNPLLTSNSHAYLWGYLRVVVFKGTFVGKIA